MSLFVCALYGYVHPIVKNSYQNQFHPFLRSLSVAKNLNDPKNKLITRFNYPRRCFKNLNPARNSRKIGIFQSLQSTDATIFARNHHEIILVFDRRQPCNFLTEMQPVGFFRDQYRSEQVKPGPDRQVDQRESLTTSLILYESYHTLKHYTYYLRLVSLPTSM